MKDVPLAQCHLCPLNSAKGPVPGSGPEHARYVVIGEAPGYEELRAGRPFVGSSGQLLDAVLDAVGLERAQVWRTNAVLCKPPTDRPPSPVEVACCRPRLLAELDKHPEAAVIAAGNTAAGALGATEKITAIRGRWQTNVRRPFLPTLHPAAVLRAPGSIKEMLLDFEKAQRPIPPPLPHFSPEITNSLPGAVLTTRELVVDVENDKYGKLLTINLAYGSELSECAVLVVPSGDWAGVIGQSLVRPDCEYIYHNGKYDTQVLRRHGVACRNDFDTMLANYTLDERKGGQGGTDQTYVRSVHGLKALAGNYFDAPDYDAEIQGMVKYKRPDGKTGKDYGLVPLSLLAKYGVLDGHYTFRLKRLLEAQLRAEGAYESPFKSILMPASEAFSKAEQFGIRVDLDLLKEAEREWGYDLEILWDKMEALAGEEFNPRSTKQVAHILYDVMRVPPPKARKQIGKSLKGGSARSTDKTSLIGNMDLKGPGGDVVRAMLKFRRVDRMVSNYIDVIKARVDGRGYVHWNTKIHGTEVGRVAIEEPALHGTPRADDKEEGQYGKTIRDLFIASDGYLLGSADLSQAELRIAAALSNCANLIRIFREGGDPHAKVSDAVFGGHDEEQRYVAKVVNFGVIYGGRKSTLMARVLDFRGFRPGMIANQAAVGKIVDDYMTTFKELFDWQETQHQTAMKEGQVSTRTGRVRRFYLITRDNVEEVRKASLHQPVAGLASDIILLAFNRLSLEGIRVMLTVHDSIIFEAPVADMPRVAARVKQVITEEWDRWVPEVPCDVDVKVGERWGSLKKGYVG